MINRFAKKKVIEMAQKFPVLVFTGPRQSGKTTLCKIAFPTYRYVSLENPDMLYFATSDPKGFLKVYDKYVIIDEVQNAPQLFSYIQQLVDDANVTGQYILSGSQNFLLLEKITQSLAGRVYMMELLPLNHKEIAPIAIGVKEQTVYEEMVIGSYPRVYDKGINPQDFYGQYIQTYIERDVRSIINVQDLTLFRKFLMLLSHHVGRLFNANSISKNLGIDVKTVQRWLSILEASYIVFTLPSWYKNFSKRIVKTPKLYFYDIGLVAYLLGIETSEELILSSYKGALFENYGLLELLKSHKNLGIKHNYYFWRDSNGHEIDLIIEQGQQVKCVEFKASETVKSEYIKALHYLDGLDRKINLSHYLFNTQDITQKRSNETIVSWKDVATILK
ncbi:MAG: ATP-binding protein [Vicingaceae bacterium]|nr:ATP-binding protein [Vicingaceae bacterium]